MDFNVMIGVVAPFLGTVLGSAMVFLLKKDIDPEACWVRITGTNGRKLTGKILTKTMQDFDLELEEIIEFGTMTKEDKSISCVCIL